MNVKQLFAVIISLFSLSSNSYSNLKPDLLCDNSHKETLISVGSFEPLLVQALSHCYRFIDKPAAELIHEIRTTGYLQPAQKNSLKASVTRLLLINNDSLVDFSSEKFLSKRIAYINQQLDNDIKVLLVNFDGNQIGKITGLGYDNIKYTLLRKYQGKLIVEPFNLNREPVNDFDVEMSQDIFSDGNQLMREIGTAYISSDKNSAASENATALYLNILRSATKHHFPEVETLSRITSGDHELPGAQVYKGYLRLYRHDTITGSQKYENDLTIEYTLMASYNPYNKYLRLKAMGSGFNPTSGKGMQWDGSYDRGYFQNKVNIGFRAQDYDVYMNSHAPLNVNNKTSYTSGSSVTVGVDISENPGFNSSYTVTESSTKTISDFNIIDKTSGSKASWNYQLSRTESSKWNMFYSPGIFSKDKVHGLPHLAKSNLSPAVVGMWRVGGGETGSKKFEINWSVEYLNAWVTGDWLSFTRRWRSKTRNWGWWRSNPVRFYFSRVKS